jgi:hypothetical protein
MYQTIAESVSVAGVYHQGSFVPKKFKWRHRTLSIDEITLVSDVTDGGVKKRLYGVVVANEVYRLEFDRDNENWLLAEIWVE